MKVKGTAVIPLNKFVKEKFGEDKHTSWLDMLDKAGKDVYSQIILPTEWYDVEEVLLNPIRKLAKLCYGGDEKKCAWETGEFSADYGLKGIYKVFIKIGSAGFLIKKASTILPTYYNPSKLEVIDATDNSSKMKISDMTVKDNLLEYRIAGWMKRALEINGCKDVKVEVEKSISSSDHGLFAMNWK